MAQENDPQSLHESLTSREYEKLVEKVRKQYRELAKKHNDKAFDLNAFNDRWYHVLQNKLDMMKFLLTEVGFLEELKSKFNKIVEDKQKVQVQLQEISQKRFDKIKDYPREVFHPRGDDELKYFYGALRQYALCYLPPLEQVYRGTAEWYQLSGNILEMERMAWERGGLPPRLKKHCQVLDTQPQDSEKDKQAFLKEGAFALKQLSLGISCTLEHLKDSSKITLEDKNPLREKFGDSIGALTLMQSLMREADQIVENFNLTAFVSNL